MKFRNSYFIGILLLFCGMLNSSAAIASASDYIVLDTGNTAYIKGDYAKALTFYQKFVNEGKQSAQAYYNMGNCYYKTNEFAKAILYYEKAEKLSPGDPDIQFNLQLANQKITDRVPAESPLFLYTGWKKFVNTFTEKQWALVCIWLLCCSLLLFALYLYFSNLFLKQASFWAGCVVLLSCFFTFYLANSQYDNLISHDTAIVMSATVNVKGAPEDKATLLFVVHEGTKVAIIKNEGEWTEVKLANGNQGWLNSSDIGAI
jgi:tetratricopeptide (TPR) repeat protein